MTAPPGFVPIRLRPGDDLRGALEAAARDAGWPSAFVVAGIGSLVGARLRFAGRPTECVLAGDFELVSLSGSLAVNGSHLHMTVADARGAVFGGHVAPGNLVRTTAEVLIAPLAEWHLARELDPATGYAELVVARRD